MQCGDACFAYSLFWYRIIRVENYCGSHYVYLGFSLPSAFFSYFFCSQVSVGLLDLGYLQNNLAVVSVK